MKYNHMCYCFCCDSIYHVKDHRDDKKCSQCKSEDTIVLEIVDASSAGRKHKTGAAPLSSSRRCESGSRQPRGISHKSARYGFGRDMSHPRPREKHQKPPAKSFLGPPLSGSPLCPPDCPSKRFCDPSSCALESVREANVIAERLRGAE